MILQCVNELYELIQTTLWEETEPRINRLVFIGNKEKAERCSYCVSTLQVLISMRIHCSNPLTHL